MQKRIRYMSLCLGLMGVFLLGTACTADDSVVFVESEAVELAETDARREDGSDTENDGKNASDTLKRESDLLTTEENMKETVIFEESKKIAVHVCGAVNLPGLYELEEGSRIMDAILCAGGFSNEADEEYLNLATVLSDGDKVRIPTRQEVAELSEQDKMQNVTGVSNEKERTNEEFSSAAKVNINTAGEAELCTLPGIGKTRAESILAYRSEYGAFEQIEDIMKISGIKESSFQKIKDKITVK